MLLLLSLLKQPFLNELRGDCVDNKIYDLKHSLLTHKCDF